MRLLALALALSVLTGCATASVAPAASPPALSETIERNGVEERAIAAVKDYVSVSSAIAADGGVDPERIATVVTDRWLPEELAGFETLRAMGSSQVGIPAVTRIEVAAVRGIAVVTEVILRACTDFGEVSVDSAEGEEHDVPTTVALVTVYVKPVDGVLKVDRVEPHTDASWCAAS